MNRPINIQCDGPICNPKFILKDDPEAEFDATINFIIMRKGDKFSTHGWDVYVPAEGKNYHYCPRCARAMRFRMGI